MINFSGLLANLGVFFWPLTAILGVALYNSASYLWVLAAGKGGGELARDIVVECATLSQLVGMGGTIAGLVTGLSLVDPGNPATLANLTAAMALAFYTTYFGLATAIGCRTVVMFGPYLERQRVGRQAPAPAPAGRLS